MNIPAALASARDLDGEITISVCWEYAEDDGCYLHETDEVFYVSGTFADGFEAAFMLPERHILYGPTRGAGMADHVKAAVWRYLFGFAIRQSEEEAAAAFEEQERERAADNAAEWADLRNDDRRMEG